jgi:hypothetical protein
MQKLKDELRENFIKPLKFKFLMQKLENETSKKEITEKEKVLKNIHDAYKEF